jgi:hypothetical protein
MLTAKETAPAPSGDCAEAALICPASSSRHPLQRRSLPPVPGIPRRSFRHWPVLNLGTRAVPFSLISSATTTGSRHAVGTSDVGNRNRVDPEHCNNWPLLSRRAEAGRRPAAPHRRMGEVARPKAADISPHLRTLACPVLTDSHRGIFCPDSAQRHQASFQAWGRCLR